MFNLTAFITFVLVGTFSPGPNNIMSLVSGTHYGYKKTLPFLLGVFSAFSTIMLATSYLNLFLYNLIPKIKPYMYAIGAAYMLYLAYKVLNSKMGEAESDKLNTFGAGFTLQFINPKVLLYGITVTSSFIIPHFSAFWILLGFAILLACITFVATSSWALFGASFKKVMVKYQKPFNIGMALLLVYSAVTIILELF